VGAALRSVADHPPLVACGLDLNNAGPAGENDTRFPVPGSWPSRLLDNLSGTTVLFPAPGSTGLATAYFRISELAPQSPAAVATFGFAAGTQGCQAIGGTRLTAASAGLK